MSPRPIFALLSLIFVAGALLLEFFVILGGAVNGAVVDNTWFLEVDTSGITGQQGQLSHWTYWNACPTNNGLNTVCNVAPAYPLDPPSNFGTQQDIPMSFMGTSKFYYETRFMFAFALIALFFSACSLLLGLLAMFSRIGSYLSGATATIAWAFQTLTAALMTAAYVEGRNIFNSNNMAASLGRYAFGFQWAAMACLFISTVLFCLGGATSKDRSYRNNKNRGSFIDGETSSFTRA